jgi:predicted nucleotidyltransferase
VTLEKAENQPIKELEKPSPSFSHAITVAAFFNAHSQVHEVFLVGSLARRRIGDDIDIVAVTGDTVVERWINVVNDAIVKRRPISYLQEAGRIFNIDEDVLRKLRVGPDRLQRNIDVFLFPADWMLRSDQLQEKMEYNDKRYIRNLAQDALVFQPQVAFVKPPAVK